MSYAKPPVEVTQDLIDHAIQRDSSHCVVADALKANMPNASRVSVDLQTVRYTDTKRGKRYTYLTPPVCQRVLLDFDQGNLIEPFAFRLGPPIHIATSATVRRKDGQMTRPHRTRSVKNNGNTGQVPTVLDGVAPPSNGALATGSTNGSAKKGKLRQFGLRQLKA
jgi:hypothetical protein